MTADMLDLEPAAAEMKRVLSMISDDQLAGPTPCDVDVAAVLGHVHGLVLAFTYTAKKETPPGGSQPPELDAQNLDPQWRQAVPECLDQLVQAWQVPSAWEGTAEAGGVTWPAADMGAVALDELVLHGWDLARATGQSFNCDPVSTEVVFEFTKASSAPGAEASRNGIFGPVVPVSADATKFEQALGMAGRNPDWVP